MKADVLVRIRTAIMAGVTAATGVGGNYALLGLAENLRPVVMVSAFVIGCLLGWFYDVWAFNTKSLAYGDESGDDASP